MTWPPDPGSSAGVVHRRRVVVAVTLVVGAGLLAVSLRVRPGDAAFYGLTALLALTWTAGGLLSGPLRLGRVAGRGGLRRPLLVPLLTGLALGGMFLLGALAVREFPPLAGYVDDVLAHAGYGNLAAVTAVTMGNGIAEEIFFRGGLFAALGRHTPVVLSTLAYTLVTLATGNPMLVFAAAVVGLVLGWQRRTSGGILAPTITHLTWSLLMLYALPALFRI